MQGVDANDTGQNISTALYEGIRPMSVSGVIAAMNGVWDEELSAADEDARFGEAVALATGILERELRGAAAYQRALSLVREAIGRSATRGSSSSTASSRGTRPSSPPRPRRST